jgi:mono/diheme cytochrome c family protein
MVLSIAGTLTFSLVFSASAASAATPAEEGEAIFKQKCQACHTIGGGRTVGPDLKDITTKREKDWLVAFISTPEKLIEQDDPIAKELVQQYGLPMPNMGVREDDAEAILAYMEAASGQPVITPVPATGGETQPASTPVLEPNARIGKFFFTGSLVFTNNGPACLSCHNVNTVGIIGGGTMGKDLSASYATMGKTAIDAILTTMPFPMMKAVYSGVPLTEEEVASVSAFLAEASSAPEQRQNPNLFFIIGGAGALLLVGMFQLLWRGRLTGVRRSLVKGGSK